MQMVTALFALILIITAVGITILLVMRKRYDARVDGIWSRLADREECDESFSPEMVEGLFPLARTYFLHALRPGTPLPQGVVITMTGSLRVSEKADWVPFRGRQILCGPEGFVWKATVRMAGPMTISGADCYYRGEGQVRFFLLGLLPFASGSGESVSRSAAGRAIIESIWLPPVLLPLRGASWKEVNQGRATVTLPPGTVPTTITLTFGDGGNIIAAEILRYRGNEGKRTGPLPFGVAVEQEREFGGITIPAKVCAGWELKTDRSFEFIRIDVEDAEFF